MADGKCAFCNYRVSLSAKFCPKCSHPLILHNRYRLLWQEGKGGFGSVYEATDIKLGRRCAVKEILTTQLTKEPEILAIRSFLRQGFFAAQ